MRAYRLEYEDDRFGAEKVVAFEAANAAGALEHAKREAKGRWARLYEEGRPLCRLERACSSGDNLWIVAAVGRESEQVA